MKRSGQKVPPLTEEPLAIDNFWENQFSVRVWPLLDEPQSSGRPHWIESMNPRIHEHHKLDLMCVKEKEKEEDIKLVMKGSWINFERVARDGVNVIKMYCKKFSGTMKRFIFLKFHTFIQCILSTSAYHHLTPAPPRASHFLFLPSSCLTMDTFSAVHVCMWSSAET